MATVFDKYVRSRNKMDETQLSLYNPLLQPIETAEDAIEVETPEQRKARISKAVMESTEVRTSYKQGSPLGDEVKPRRLFRHIRR